MSLLPIPTRQPVCPECGDGLDLDPSDGRGPRLHPGDYVECCDREYLLTDDGEGDIGIADRCVLLDIPCCVETDAFAGIMSGPEMLGLEDETGVSL